MRCYRKILRILYKDLVINKEIRAKIQQAIGPHEDLLTTVKRRKLQWYGHVSRSLGLAKPIMQGTVKGGRRQGRQRKRWEDNIREWTGLEFGKSQRAVENREKRRKLVAKSSVVPQRPSRLRDWWWWYFKLFQPLGLCFTFQCCKSCDSRRLIVILRALKSQCYKSGTFQYCKPFASYTFHLRHCSTKRSSIHLLSVRTDVLKLNL